MIVHGFEITPALQARLLRHICRLGTFRNRDLIAAVRDVAGKDIEASVKHNNALPVSASEVAMRCADVLIRQMKKTGAIRQGTKRGDWIAKPVEAEESWGR
jgi:hypothetical protein